jgi:hypothetical protein
VKGRILWIRARPRSRSSRARFSEQGIRGFFLLSSTKTDIDTSSLGLKNNALTGL